MRGMSFIERVYLSWTSAPLVLRILHILGFLALLYLIIMFLVGNRIFPDDFTESELENIKLKTELTQVQEANRVSEARADTLLAQRKRDSLNRKIITIKEKYNGKRDIVINQPLDSTVRDLSEWLNK